MFYIFRQDRPELFEKRDRIRESPGMAVREVLALIAERGEEPSDGR